MTAPTKGAMALLLTAKRTFHTDWERLIITPALADATGLSTRQVFRYLRGFNREDNNGN